MARKAREKSPIGVYSVKLKSNLYSFSREDHELFLRCLTAYEGYSVLSYLLTRSFFTFIIKEEGLTLEQIMRKVTVKFVCAYKKAHNIDTSVFQDRFSSSPAYTLQDVYSMMGKMMNLSPETDRPTSITTVQNWEMDTYVSQSFFHEHFVSADDFNEKCHAHLNAERVMKKLSDEELAEFLREMYHVEPEDLLKLPKSHVIAILDGVMSISKTSARQIARVSTLPVRWLWKVTKQIAGKAKIKNEKKVTLDE